MRSFRSQARRSDAPPDNVVRLFQSETAEILETPEPRRTRATVLTLGAMLFSLIGLTFWAQIDRAVTSMAAVVVTHDPTVVVQALDPSIVKTLDVHVGQQVKAGQLLATLDPTFTTADVVSYTLQLAAFDAQIARCEAELARRPFQPPQSADPAIAKYGQLQQVYYQQRKEQYDQQVRSYDEQIAQIKATTFKLANDSARYGDRTQLAKQVEDMRSTLAAVQAGSRLQLLQAIDTKTELLRSTEFDQNALVEAQHQLQATTATRDAFIQQWLGQASQELVTARTQRDTTQQLLDKATRHKDLVRMEAPQDAIVLTKGNASVGSVLNAGDMLFTLAPLSSPLEADLEVSTMDVGFVRVGDEVTLKFDTFNFVEHGTAEGVVTSISEGAFFPNNSGSLTGAGTPTSMTYNGTPNVPQSTSMLPQSPYYEVRVAITKNNLYKVPADFRLMPGITLTADIHVGTRSLFMYILGSMRGMTEAMREP